MQQAEGGPARTRARWEAIGQQLVAGRRRAPKDILIEAQGHLLRKSLD